MKSSPKKTWELLKPLARPHLKILLLAILLGSVTASAQAAVLLLFAPIWDQVLFPPAVPVEGAEQSVLASFFEPIQAWARESGAFADERFAILLALAGIAMVLAVIAGAGQWGFSWFSRQTSYRMIVDLRVQIARHLMGLSLRYHGQRRFGDLLSRVSSDVTTVLGAVNVGLKGMVLEPLMAIAALVAAFIAAPLPALGMIIVLPVAVLPIAKLAKKVRKGSKKSLTSLGASVQNLTQIFQGIRTVKSFGGEERELENYREQNRDYLRTSMRMVRAIAMTHSWTAFYSVAGVAVLVVALGFLKIEFDLFKEPGQMTAFFLAIARLNNHVKNFAKSLTKVEESVGASIRLTELLEEPADVVERPDAVPISGLGEGLRFQGVSFTYPDAEGPALRDIDLAIRPGETLALVGASGSGKSTLMDLIARFIDPQEGAVCAGARDLRDLKLKDWNALYAMVGQVPFLFHSTLAENIGYGKPGASQAEIEEAARAANIHDFIASLPEGYATNAADMGSRLSGGQRQRITIARALLKGAPLLLLDEATSALDSESEREVQRALDRLMADRTVVVIAHRLATIRRADRIAVLDDGCLVELGTHAELIEKNGTYARLHALQQLEAHEEAAT